MSWRLALRQSLVKLGHELVGLLGGGEGRESKKRSIPALIVHLLVVVALDLFQGPVGHLLDRGAAQARGETKQIIERMKVTDAVRAVAR